MEVARDHCRLVRGAISALIVTAIAVLAVGLSARPAVAQDQTTDGLDVSSSKIYTPDPVDEAIEVYATYTMTNLQADELIGDTVRSYFYTRWVIAMPATATDFSATGAGQRLTTTIEADDDAEDVVFASIALPFNLNFQQTVTIEVNYTIPGGEPRAEGAIARVNDSFLSFSVWATGDPGQTDVRVMIPDGFTMDLQGDLDEFNEVTEDGQGFLEATNIDEPHDFFGRVFGRNDSGLITESADLPDATATVRAWPDDPDWADFVVNAIEEDVPVIEDLTGLNWPAGDIEVIETVTPYLYGYGGWFNASSGRIEVGENLERDLILHELGHAWFNDELIEGRWITEGLAEEFASRTIEATGDERPDPEEPDLADPLRVPLSEWASPWTLAEEDAFAYEQYHYNASWWVMRQITDEVGLDAFSDVLISLEQDDLAFRGDGPREQTRLSTRWTHFFDLLEIQAGAEGLDELFAAFVLAEADIERLGERRATLAKYNELLAASESWGAPLVLRRELSAWRFDDAHLLIDNATEVIALRDRVDSLVDELDVLVDRSAEPLYEAATTQEDLDRARDMEAALERDLAELLADRTDATAMADALGTQVEFASMAYSDAVADVSDQLAEIANVADLRDRVETRAASLKLTAPAWPSASATTNFAAEGALAEARLATLNAIEAATATVAGPRTFTERIGLLANDPDSAIDDARAAFEADALDDALSHSARAEQLISAASASGTTRLTWLAVLIVATATILIRRRGAQNRPPPQNPPPENKSGDTQSRPTR